VNINHFLQSKPFRRAIVVVGSLVVIFLAFAAGVFVGYSKARFSYASGDSYARIFIGSGPPGMFGMMPGMSLDAPQFFSAHGTSGSVLSIDAGSGMIVLGSPDNTEKIIYISSSTVVRKDRIAIGVSDIKEGDSVLVIGDPNDQGQIEARLVRVLDN